MTPEKTRLRNAARLLTNALNPFFVFTALYAAVALSEAESPAALGYLALELLAAGLVAGYVLLMRRRRRVSDFWISARAQRLLPAAFLLGAFVLLLAALSVSDAPGTLFSLTLSMGLTASAVAALTLIWKASAHAAVAGHAALAGPLLLGPAGLLFTLALPLVIWARLSPEAHTPPQALAGAGVGVIFAFIFLV